MVTNPVEIQAIIQRVLIDVFELNVDLIVPEARLKEDLDLDSLDAIDLGVAIEEGLGVKLNQSALAPLRTVGEIQAYLIRSLT